MCGFAVALGYKEIYLAGVDLYDTNKSYAFDTLTPNLLALNLQFSTKPNKFHNANTDLEALEFLAKTYDVRFYSLCPNSPLSKYVPLAPISNATFLVQNKRGDYTSDILIPTNTAYKKMFKNQKNVQELKNNIYFKIAYDLLRLPNHIKKYIKGRKLGKITKMIKKMGGGNRT